VSIYIYTYECRGLQAREHRSPRPAAERCCDRLHPSFMRRSFLVSRVPPRSTHRTENKPSAVTTAPSFLFILLQTSLQYSDVRVTVTVAYCSVLPYNPSLCTQTSRLQVRSFPVLTLAPFRRKNWHMQNDVTAFAVREESRKRVVTGRSVFMHFVSGFQEVVFWRVIPN
jgi:hypothetical protein